MQRTESKGLRPFRVVLNTEEKADPLGQQLHAQLSKHPNIPTNDLSALLSPQFVAYAKGGAQVVDVATVTDADTLFQRIQDAISNEGDRAFRTQACSCLMLVCVVA